MLMFIRLLAITFQALCIQAKGVGPRYCLSIEDKIVKFKEKKNTKYSLNEGLKDNTISQMVYQLSTRDTAKILSKIKGLEEVKMKRLDTQLSDYVDPRS